MFTESFNALLEGLRDGTARPPAVDVPPRPPLDPAPSFPDHYVCGYMMNAGLDRVALRQYEQSGARFLDGVTGCVIPWMSYTAHTTMLRTWKEATGQDTSSAQWSHFCTMKGRRGSARIWQIDVFFGTGDLGAAASAPLMSIHDTKALPPVVNPWVDFLVPMARVRAQFSPPLHTVIKLDV